MVEPLLPLNQICRDPRVETKGVWHRYLVVPNFVLGSYCAKFELCRDYTLQNLLGNITLNHSTENILLYGTCLVTLLKFYSKEWV